MRFANVILIGLVFMFNDFFCVCNHNFVIKSSSKRLLAFGVFLPLKIANLENVSKWTFHVRLSTSCGLPMDVNRMDSSSSMYNGQRSKEPFKTHVFGSKRFRTLGRLQIFRFFEEISRIFDLSRDFALFIEF